MIVGEGSAADGESCHLTYCTNIHPGETWAEVRRNLGEHVPAVRARLAPDRPFGIGLRLSAEAAHGLAQPEALREFKEFMARERLYVFTLERLPLRHLPRQARQGRGLPSRLAGRQARRVHRPAGRSAGGACCTAEAGPMGSISTVPGAFKENARTPEAVRAHGRADGAARCAPGAAEAAHRQVHHPGARARARLLPRDHRRERRVLSRSPVCRRRGAPALRAHRARPRDQPAGAARPSGHLPRSVPRGGRVRGSAGLRGAARQRRDRCLQAADHRRAAAARAVASRARRRAPVRRSGLSASSGGSGTAGPATLRRPARCAAQRRRALAGRSGVARALPRADLHRRPGRVLVDAAVRPRSAAGTSAASPSPRIWKWRPTPGVCCRRRLARPTWTRPSRARSPGRATSSSGADGVQLSAAVCGRRQARPRLQPAHGVDQHAGGRDAGRRARCAIRACRCCWSRLSLFYIGGMYLNDAFDREFDARARPDRPDPGGPGQRIDRIRCRLRHARSRRGAAGVRRIRLPRRHRLAAAGLRSGARRGHRLLQRATTRTTR